MFHQKKLNNIKCFQGGKLVATVAPTTTLPQLNNDSHHSHRKHGHHDNDANTLPNLSKTAPDPATRQNSFATTVTPDRVKRDNYGNKLPMTPTGLHKLNPIFTNL